MITLTLALTIFYILGYFAEEVSQMSTLHEQAKFGSVDKAVYSVGKAWNYTLWYPCLLIFDNVPEGWHDIMCCALYTVYCTALISWLHLLGVVNG